MKPSTAKMTCPWCKKKIRLNLEGKLKMHKSLGGRFACFGSHRRPSDKKATLADCHEKLDQILKLLEE